MKGPALALILRSGLDLNGPGLLALGLARALRQRAVPLGLLLGSISDGARTLAASHGLKDSSLGIYPPLASGSSPLSLFSPGGLGGLCSVLQDLAGQTVSDHANTGTAVIALNHRSALAVWLLDKMGHLKFLPRPLKIVSTAVGKGGEAFLKFLPMPLIRVSGDQNRWIAQKGGGTGPVIGNGLINPDEISSLPPVDEARAKLRQSLGWPSDAFVACSLSSHYPVKGTLRLPQVAALCPGLHLVMAGSGPLEQSLARRVDELGIGHRCRLVPAIPNRLELLAGADIFLHLPDDETFCIAATEAMALGVPPVVPALGALPELMVHQSTGFLLRDPSPTSAADLVRGLMNDLDLVRDCGHRAMHTARNRFRDTLTLERYLGLMGFSS